MIFAAGLGTRLRPLTDTMPKALVPLGGKTLLQYQIERLREADICDIIINVHHFPEQIIDYLQTNNNFDCNIAISDEREQLLETGGGLRKAQWFLAPSDSRNAVETQLAASPIINYTRTDNAITGDAASDVSTSNTEPFLVCNVDILSNIDLKALIRAHKAEDIATVVVSPRETQRYLLFDDELRMHGWMNIKTGEVRGNYQLSIINYQLQKLAFSGMQILSPRIFTHMDAFPEKFSLIDLYVSICQTETIRAFVPQDYRMMDVGKIDHLSEAEAFALSL